MTEPLTTRFLVGLRTDQPTKLVLTAVHVPAAAAPLVIVSRDGSSRSVPHDAAGWRCELPAGDHFLQLAVPMSVPVGRLELAADASAGWLKSASGTVATWRHTNVAVEDPKDPWPPPLLLTEMPDRGWLIKTANDVAQKANFPRDL